MNLIPIAIGIKCDDLKIDKGGGEEVLFIQYAIAWSPDQRFRIVACCRKVCGTSE